MTMWTHTDPLPDPDVQPEFYEGVLPKRFVAWLIDCAFVVVLSVLILPFTAFTGIFFFPLLMLVVGFLYRWATLAGGSATFGMRIMAIEIRRADGDPLDGMTALLHTLGYALSISTALVQLGSVGLMMFSDRGRGLTDHVLGTVALNRRAM